MNRAERTVYRLYRSLNIRFPEQLNISHIAAKINLPVHYWEFGSEAVFYQGRSKVFLNENLSSQQKWQNFGHEVCHVSGHAGSQSDMNMPFLRFQEGQANHFAYHFCVPTFMLENIYNFTIYDIMNLFNVEYEFALRRLEMYERKIISERAYC